MSTYVSFISRNGYLFSFLSTICILIICFKTGNCYSYSCNHAGIGKDKEQLMQMVEKINPEQALALSKSILLKVNRDNVIDCEDVLWVKYSRAAAFEMINEHHLAVELYHEILPIALKKKYWELLADTYISLGRSHEILRRYSDSKRNLDEAKKIIDKYNLEKVYARLCYRASSHFSIYKSKVDTAIQLAETAVALGKKHNYRRAKADGYLLLGILEKDELKRLSYFKKGRDINIKAKIYKDAVLFNNRVASIYKGLGQWDQAKKTAQKSIYYASLLEEEEKKSHHYLKGLQQAHRMMSQIYLIKGNLDSVNLHSEKVKYLEKQREFNTNLEKIDEVEPKNAIELEQIKTELVNKKLVESRWILLLSAFLIFIGGFIIYILFKNRNQIRAQNLKIAAQNKQLDYLSKKRGVLLTEVHHRVKNNLQNIVSLLAFQVNQIQDPKSKKYLEDVSNKIFTIALIHEHLYRDDEFESINMGSYLSELSQHYKQVYRNLRNINFEIKTNSILLNIETSISLGIICAELISNSIKYAQSSNGLKINIDLKRLVGQNYIFEYRDNGIGYEVDYLDDSKSGIGMLLIKSMSRQLNAELVLSHLNGAKTTLNFIPKTVSKI